MTDEWTIRHASLRLLYGRRADGPCGRPPTGVDPPRALTTTKNNIIVNDTAFVNASDSLVQYAYFFGLDETGMYVFSTALETHVEQLA